ncbi:MAG: hypothetical protein HYS13_02970 [Planctomycetia bacterium]|nr:hypothetical protein [Planctomycetia bacterium]
MYRVSHVSSWLLTALGTSLMVVGIVLVPAGGLQAQGYGVDCLGDDECDNGCTLLDVTECSMSVGNICSRITKPAKCGACVCSVNAVGDKCTCTK